jgi:transcriptional regulator with XRE-family HTH domain
MYAFNRRVTMPKYITQPKPSAKREQEPDAMSNRHVLKAEFAKRLYSKIAERGWTQSEFARNCDLARDAVSTYVRGRSIPSPQALEKMASVLNVRPEDLLPNYYEAAHNKQEPTFELRDVPNEEGYMWIKLNMRLPKKLAMEIFMLAQSNDGK